MDPEVVQQRFQGLFPGLLGIRLTEVSQDVVKAELPGRADLCTVPGMMHGGAIMAFADTLGAVATVLNLPPGARTTTIESKTNFFRKVDVTDTATAECAALHKGRTTMVWQTRIFDGQGKLAALVTQTQMVISG